MWKVWHWYCSYHTLIIWHLFCDYVDFSKAFNTVNNEILLMNLHEYGGIILKWFKSYRSGRSQYVSHLCLLNMEFRKDLCLVHYCSCCLWMISIMCLLFMWMIHVFIICLQFYLLYHLLMMSLCRLKMLFSLEQWMKHCVNYHIGWMSISCL